MDSYPYSDAWKATVDKCSEDWRSYCEALGLLKRYLKVEQQEGHQRAVQDYKATLARMNQDPRSQTRVSKLNRDFLLIGINEAEKLLPTV